MTDKLDKHDNEQPADNNCGDPEVPSLPHSVPTAREAQGTQEKTHHATQYVAKAFHTFRAWAGRAWTNCLSKSAFWMAAATIVIAIANVRYTQYAEKQWGTMRDTLSEIKNQSWVMGKTFRAERPVFKQHIHFSFKVDKQQSLRATVELTNVGHTVSVDLHAFTSISIADSDPFNSPVYWHSCPAFGFVGPSDTISCETDSLSVNADDISAFQQTGKRLYIRVYAYYGENIEKDAWITQTLCTFYKFGEPLDHLTDCASANFVWENNSGREKQKPPNPPPGAPPPERPPQPN